LKYEEGVTPTRLHSGQLKCKKRRQDMAKRQRSPVQVQPERSEASTEKLIDKKVPHYAVAGRQLKHIKKIGL
jgi:hypothetical protein